MMISSAIAVSLMLAAQLPAAGQRQQFANCLRAFMNEKLEARTAVPEFETAVATACREQESAYRTAYVAAATRAGDPRPRAESDSNVEVQDLRANFLELFRGSQPE
jgi:hypothetical protein